MENPNRISQLSLTQTIDRQTPKNEFGDVLANTLAKVARVGGALASGMTNGMPVVSAAVSAVSTMSSAISATSTAAANGVVGGAAPRTVAGPGAASALPSGQGEVWDVLQAQSMMSKEYLMLQNEMQRESREFNAISNIIKVRHDSAKAAINNIR